MHWFYLGLAGLFEVGFTICLKLSDGFKRPGWTAGFVVAGLISFGLLTLSLDGIPLGTAYAVWTGIGAAGTALVGMLYFREPADPVRIALIAALIATVVGLKWVS
jgi:quaternary ammonium compound-resistance protein SugE